MSFVIYLFYNPKRRNTLKKHINLGQKTIEYTLDYKHVKNINLRIKSDASVYVSANNRVSTSEIERFMLSKAEFILKAIEKFENTPKKERFQYFREDEIKEIITDICKKVYPCFESRGIKFPIVKFRKMVSRWGSCNYVKGIVTFNTALMYAPYECIEYVVYHEFCHFLQANHSKKFYDELERVCPKHKEYRKILKGISIR